MEALAVEISELTGRDVEHVAPLTGGCVGEVYRVWLDGGDSLVVKTGRPGDPLDVEGWMLGYLGDHGGLPIPGVLLARDSLLVMTYIDGEDALSVASEFHAAELVAALHGVTAPEFGLDRDTVIGGIAQPNGFSASWVEFFRDRRLLYMAEQAEQAGRLSGDIRARIDNLAARIGEFIDEPLAPSLIHGDMWGGNVLVHGDRIAGFVDPAIYYGDAEIELAFSTMFATFGEGFFRRYDELRPLRPGFFEVRRDIYNLWPLLVHARLFGGGYAQSVENTLSRFGF
ncbi:MAG: fructosamine kinase family protein [Rhodospirillales bacterium]|nr:fructosamine kinase family protein [Rhodospirillales bacterium]